MRSRELFLHRHCCCSGVFRHTSNPGLFFLLFGEFLFFVRNPTEAQVCRYHFYYTSILDSPCHFGISNSPPSPVYPPSLACEVLSSLSRLPTVQAIRRVILHPVDKFLFPNFPPPKKLYFSNGPLPEKCLAMTFPRIEILPHASSLSHSKHPSDSFFSLSQKFWLTFFGLRTIPYPPKSFRSPPGSP